MSRGIATWLAPMATILILGGASVMVLDAVVGTWAHEEAAARDARTTEAFERLLADLSLEDATLLTEVETRAAREGLAEARTLGAALFPDPAQGDRWFRRREAQRLEEARQRAGILAELQSARARGRGAAMMQRLRAEEVRAAEDSAGSALSLRLAAWVLALVATVLVGGWVFVHYRVTRPLREVRRTIEELDAGREARTSPRGLPAVRGVTQAFNALADGFGRSRRSLEEQVDAKTRALADALEEQRAQSHQLEGVLQELRSAQGRLVHQERMAALGALSGGVAHEFNNILGGIKGCAEGVLADVEDPELAESLEVLLRAAGRGRKIVEGLLRFSQAAARTPRHLEVEPLLADVVALLEPEAAARGVRVELLPGPPVTVVADPAELHQVFDNLLRNAVQASPSGSAVSIEVAPGGSRVAIAFRDAGGGIPKDVAPRLFEPFFTTREREGGTGLGLAISHGIVEALGGTLAFRCPRGGGTVFEVTLPLAEDEHAG